MSNIYHFRILVKKALTRFKKNFKIISKCCPIKDGINRYEMTKNYLLENFLNAMCDVS